MRKTLACLTIIAFIVLEVYAGVRLLTDPADFSALLVSIFGVFMIIFGLISVIHALQIRSDSRSRLPYKLSFLGGIIDIIIGVACIVLKEKIVGLIPGLMMIIGIIMVISGIQKIRNYLLLRDYGIRRSWLAVLNAILTIILGVLVFLNPFTATEIAWTYTGYALIFEAIFDALVFVVCLIL